VLRDTSTAQPRVVVSLRCSRPHAVRNGCCVPPACSASSPGRGRGGGPALNAFSFGANLLLREVGEICLPLAPTLSCGRSCRPEVVLMLPPHCRPQAAGSPPRRHRCNAAASSQVTVCHTHGRSRAAARWLYPNGPTATAVALFRRADHIQCYAGGVLLFVLLDTEARAGWH
jgi:hypothetical protein